jgi:hypothetical protein
VLTLKRIDSMTPNKSLNLICLGKNAKWTIEFAARYMISAIPSARLGGVPIIFSNTDAPNIGPEMPAMTAKVRFTP